MIFSTPIGCAQKELFLVFIIALLGLFQRNLILPWIFLGRKYDTDRTTYWLKFVADLTFLGVPSLLALTILSEHLVAMATLMGAISGVLLLFVVFEASEHHFGHSLRQSWSRILEEHHRPTQFVTYFRSLSMILVTIAILAVDFPVFPRKFAKTEKFGHSIMDIGVAAFVFQSALGSRMAKSPNSGRLHQNRKSWWKSSTVLLFGLGAARAIVLEVIGYPKQVKEYGVHWNFFFTLAAVRSIFRVLPRCYPLAFAAIFAICHQTTLKSGNLQEWILDEHLNRRENLLTANAEGVASLMGYLTIFYTSLALAEFLARTSIRVKSWIRRCFQLLLISLVLFFAQILAEKFVDPPCRRLVNITYIFSQLSLLTFATSLCLLIQMFNTVVWLAGFPQFSNGEHPFSSVSPCLSDSVNRHSLSFFLLSNVATGLVNLSISTESIDNWKLSTPLLFGYLSICTTIVHFVEFRKFRFVNRVHEE